MADAVNDKKIAEFSEQTLNRLSEEGLPPMPEVYHLWYAYHAGTPTEVVRAIDILIKNNKEINVERCLELYHRFLSESGDQELLQKAGSLIFTTLNDVTDVMQGVKDASSDYSGSLETVETKLSETKTIEDLQHVVQDAVKHTKNMIAQNKKLENKIDNSATSMKALQEEMEEVRREAMTDGLTGLNNRKAFDDQFQVVINEAQAEGRTFSLLMMDIDFFKAFNDNFGHQVGDQVLRLVAKTLTDGVKGKDYVARYGGEEFTVLLPETNITGAVSVGNSLRQAVANKEVINRTTGEKLGRITISVGAAQYHSGEKPNDLFERADKALYKAKDEGRNKVIAAQ